MKLYDCCMYFDEDFMLDLRLNILNDYVSKFIVVEATKDHAGKNKKLTFSLIARSAKFKASLSASLIVFFGSVCKQATFTI